MREYIVTCKTKEDLESLYEDMETPGGSLYIPDREVELVHRRPISRNTHYMLTDEEALQIKEDDRVLDVELTPEERGVNIKPLYAIDGEIPDDGVEDRGANEPQYTITTNRWSKTTNNNDAFRNWGMLRCVNEATFAGWGNDSSPNVPTTTALFTSTGRNVDVVIVDGCMDPAHPEFAVNPNGSGGSRVDQFNWFSLTNAVTGGTNGTYQYSSGGDYTLGGQQEADNNHGCHVAGTVAGNRLGWARDANIFNINPYSTAESTISSSLMIDYIREWHNTKAANPETGKKNPTITNHSYGIKYDVSISNVEWVNYRGTQYNAPLTAQQLTEFGLVNNGSTIEDVPYVSSAAAADISDAINDGIIFVSSAGNSSFKVDNSFGVDYNNQIKESGFSAEYYHRGSSPAGLTGVISVGAISALTTDEKADFSNCGPGVDVYAPGERIISSVMSGGTTDSRNNSYRVQKYPGTSMAAPQVAGVIACVAEHWPRITQQEVNAYFNAYANNPGYGPWSQTNLAALGQIGNAGSNNLSYTVTNSGNQYNFAGDATGSQPDLTVTEGDVLTFSMNVASNHPFYIVTQTSGSASTNEVTEGNLTIEDRTQGDVVWDTRGVTPGTYYYICSVHSSMNGEITVSADTDLASLQGGVNRYLKSAKIRKVPNPTGTTYVGGSPTPEQTWPRLNNKYRPILDGGNIDNDLHPTFMVYPRHPIWSRKLT